jgi:hypothetical protein
MDPLFAIQRSSPEGRQENLENGIGLLNEKKDTFGLQAISDVDKGAKTA